MDESPVPQTPWYIALIQGTTAVPRAVAKLIGTIGDQIGLFLEPTHIRRKGQAEAAVLVSKAKAEAEITVLRVENKLAIQHIEDRAAERVRKREERRQANVEAVAAAAARELPENVSDVPVDEDWITQFFDHCQDVSNEQMQSVWARLLAGEVAKPGSFSLRTLAVVKVMSKEDANVFTRFCSVVWQTHDGLTPIIPNINDLASLQRVKLRFIDFIRLDALGLIRFESITNFVLSFPNDSQVHWRYSDKVHSISKKGAENIEIGCAFLTDVGRQLAVISGATPDEEYRSWVVRSFREQGWEVIEA